MPEYLSNNCDSIIYSSGDNLQRWSPIFLENISSLYLVWLRRLKGRASVCTSGRTKSRGVSSGGQNRHFFPLSNFHLKTHAHMKDQRPILPVFPVSNFTRFYWNVQQKGLRATPAIDENITLPLSEKEVSLPASKGHLCPCWKEHLEFQTHTVKSEDPNCTTCLLSTSQTERSKPFCRNASRYWLAENSFFLVCFMIKHCDDKWWLFVITFILSSFSQTHKYKQANIHGFLRWNSIHVRAHFKIFATLRSYFPLYPEESFLCETFHSAAGLFWAELNG